MAVSWAFWVKSYSITIMNNQVISDKNTNKNINYNSLKAENFMWIIQITSLQFAYLKQS